MVLGKLRDQEIRERGSIIGEEVCQLRVMMVCPARYCWLLYSQAHSLQPLTSISCSQFLHIRLLNTHRSKCVFWVIKREPKVFLLVLDIMKVMLKEQIRVCFVYS